MNKKTDILNYMKNAAYKKTINTGLTVDLNIKDFTIKYMNPENIKTAEPFKSLFIIETETLDRIKEDIKKNGYDNSQPVILWQEKRILIDGHTRKQASIEEGIKTIPYIEISFEKEAEAVLYSKHLQIDRRNLTDQEQYKLFKILKGNVTLNEKKRQEINVNKELAKQIKVSESHVKKMKRIEKNKPIEKKVLSGDMTINKADQVLKAEKINEDVTFNVPLINANKEIRQAVKILEGLRRLLTDCIIDEWETSDSNKKDLFIHEWQEITELLKKYNII